jgi:hypothetical protein
VVDTSKSSMSFALRASAFMKKKEFGMKDIKDLRASKQLDPDVETYVARLLSRIEELEQENSILRQRSSIADPYLYETGKNTFHLRSEEKSNDRGSAHLLSQMDCFNKSSRLSATRSASRDEIRMSDPEVEQYSIRKDLFARSYSQEPKAEQSKKSNLVSSENFYQSFGAKEMAFNPIQCNFYDMNESERIEFEIIEKMRPPGYKSVDLEEYKIEINDNEIPRHKNREEIRSSIEFSRLSEPEAITVPILVPAKQDPYPGKEESPEKLSEQEILARKYDLLAEEIEKRLDTKRKGEKNPFAPNDEAKSFLEYEELYKLENARDDHLYSTDGKKPSLWGGPLLGTEDSTHVLKDKQYNLNLGNLGTAASNKQQGSARGTPNEAQNQLDKRRGLASKFSKISSHLKSRIQRKPLDSDEILIASQSRCKSKNNYY